MKAIYDGNIFKLDEPVPVKGEYEVIITFTKPLEKSQREILQYFDIWDNEDANCMTEVIKERENFSLSRNDIS
jgi:hypothetical protein